MLFENNQFIDFNNMNNMENIDSFGLIKMDGNNNLFSEKEGFFKGNMFKNLYDGYKNNMIQKFNPASEKEKLELDIYALDFAIIDLSLYLDVYPNDMNIYNQFVKYSNLYNEKVNQYEKKYGPLNLTSTDYNSYKWIENPWPWDKKGGNYNV